MAMIKLPDSLSITKEAYRPRTPDEEEVYEVYARLIHAWNHHDAAAFAGLFATHGLAVGFDGTQLAGQKEIDSALRSIFKDHHTARYVTKVRDMRVVTKDVMMLRAVAGMVPAGEFDIKPALNAVQSLVALRDIDGWVIVLFQNTPAKFDGRPHAADELSKELREILT
jgi:uncharacterized protein (TIGR02246 family)